MQDTRSYRPIVARLARAAAATAALGAAAALPACVSATKVVSNRTPIPLTPGVTTAYLPPDAYAKRSARVRLRFVDGPLKSRGSSPWNHTVNFNVTPMQDANTTAGPAQATSLTVFRDADRESFEAVAVLDPLPGRGARVEVTAPPGSTAPAGILPQISFELELVGERDLAFDPTLQPLIQSGTPPNLVFLRLFPLAAESYEFEWVYFDQAEATPADSFAARTPVRVATAQPQTRIDLTYPAGRVHVRGRAVGRFAASAADGPTRRPGRWSDTLTLPIGSPVASMANWNHATSYAEDGNAVSSMVFVDGSLKGRQMQSSLTTRDARLVGEKKYDAEGRASLSFMPAPVGGGGFAYESRFNLAAASPVPSEYGTTAFEGVVPPAVSPTRGAGKYFAEDASATGEDAYRASAEGYPYAVSEPTRDGTGRPRRSTGVGANLRLEGGHDVRFGYGNASSTELRRLFGTNVGRAAYYERNVVVDANRQAHVAYVNRAGRIIASALSGDSPPALTSVKPATFPPLTYRLEETNVRDAHAGMSRSVNKLSKEGDELATLLFTYELNGAEYSEPGQEPFPPLCQSCRYHLRIRITDPDGEPVPVRTSDDPQSAPCTGVLQPAISQDLGNPTPPPNVCAATAAVTQTSTTGTQVHFCAELSKPGEYEVVKELRLADGAVESIFANAVATSNDLDVGDFRPPSADAEERQCPNDCNAFCAAAAPDGADPAVHALHQECLTTCQDFIGRMLGTVAAQSCETLKQSIDRDVAPGGFLDGTPRDQHPEYCHVRRLGVAPSICERSVFSDIFDYRMMRINTYAAALCGGYLDPLPGTPGAPARPATCIGTPERDRFYEPVQIGARLGPAMQAVMQDYLTNVPDFATLWQQQHPNTMTDPAPHKTIWQLAAEPLSFPVIRPRTLDEQWRMFRSLYLGAKQAILAKYLESQTFQGAPNTDYCPYWNDPHAHVKRPDTFSTYAQANATTSSNLTTYCGDVCSARAKQWVSELETTCRTDLSDAFEAYMAEKLRTYCARRCEITNPVPVITTDALTQPPLADAEVLPGATTKVCIPAPYIDQFCYFETTPPETLPAGCSLSLIAKPPLTATGPGAGPFVVTSLSGGPGRDSFNAITGVRPDYQFPVRPPTDSVAQCRAAAGYLAEQEARVGLQHAKEALLSHVQETHHARCFDSDLKEAFRYRTAPGEYHFTLHYYDQAGNLVQTVPPEGVHPLSSTEVAQLEDGQQIANPAHTLVSRYEYNSLDQVTGRQTPDGGWTRFWYNGVGQSRLSQTEQQQADGRYAYVRYDRRGRIVETGLVAAVQGGATTPLDATQLQKYADDMSFPGQGFVTEQVVRTNYDRPMVECQALNPRNLRGRIVSVIATSTLGMITTCYSYDPHGKITGLMQGAPFLGAKFVYYDYDVLDGKLLARHYQPGASDELHHRYVYDSDRRLVRVETSRDGELWERDAGYRYSAHGPLARLELGADRVQGLDYLYGINGWPKGVNSDTLTPARDPGGDGATGTANAVVARDVMGSSIHYFVGDYKPVGPLTAQASPEASIGIAGGALSTLAQASCSMPVQGGCGLYDGNVTTGVAATAPLAASGGAILGTAYHYDQLYRLRSAKTFLDVDAPSNAWPQSPVTAAPTLWESRLTYDANGNIRTLWRHTGDGSPGGRWMDQLTYDYPTTAGQLTSNRLSRVEDVVPAAEFPNDLDTQGAGNYTYDLSGRLTRDAASGLNAITWNAGSRVKSIERANDTLEFVYDGLGNRVVKVAREAAAGLTRYEYFVRDEKGEILATYKWELGGGPAPPFPQLDEQVLLGTSRLGVLDAVPPGTGLATQPAPPPGAAPLKRYTRLRGDKQYELTNYLGHVQATIRDRKTPIESNNVVTHYEAVSANASEYFPFGDLMPGRSQETAPYRFGFSGLERDDELKGTGNSYYTNARLYDPRLGRWLSPDPVQNSSTSPYVGFANNPARFSDQRGTADKDEVTKKQSLGAWTEEWEKAGRNLVRNIKAVRHAQERYDAVYRRLFTIEENRWMGGAEGGPGGGESPTPTCDSRCRVIAQIGERPKNIDEMAKDAAIGAGISTLFAAAPVGAPGITAPRIVALDADAVIQLNQAHVRAVLLPTDQLVVTPNVVAELSTRIPEPIVDMDAFLGAHGITRIPAAEVQGASTVATGLLRDLREFAVPGHVGDLRASMARFPGNVGDALNLAEAGAFGADTFVTADANTIGAAFGNTRVLPLPNSGGATIGLEIVRPQ